MTKAFLAQKAFTGFKLIKTASPSSLLIHIKYLLSNQKKDLQYYLSWPNITASVIFPPPNAVSLCIFYKCFLGTFYAELSSLSSRLYEVKCSNRLATTFHHFNAEIARWTRMLYVNNFFSHTCNWLKYLPVWSSKI